MSSVCALSSFSLGTGHSVRGFISSSNKVREEKGLGPWGPEDQDRSQLWPYLPRMWIFCHHSAVNRV